MCSALRRLLRTESPRRQGSKKARLNLLLWKAQVKFRNEEGVLVSLIDDAEAARLNGQYVQLVDEASRREFFSTMTSDFNKRIAKRVYGEDNASVALLAKELDDVVLGAEKMLAHARPGKGRYGSSPLNSQLTMTDRETGVVSRIVTALSPRQLMESRIVPRYDLIVQAIKKHGLESSDVSARSGLRNSRLGKHFPEKVGSYADASDIILGDAGKAVRAKLRKAQAHEREEEGKGEEGGVRGCPSPTKENASAQA